MGWFWFLRGVFCFLGFVCCLVVDLGLVYAVTLVLNILCENIDVNCGAIFNSET